MFEIKNVLNRSKMKTKIYLLIFIPTVVFSQMTFDEGTTSGNLASSMAQSVTGNGGQISNASIKCPKGHYATFTNDTELGLGTGITLSTGKVADINNDPSNFAGTSGSNVSTNNQLFADIGGANASDTYDDCILSFDLKPNCDTFKITYTFASEEYPEFVGQGFNDLFAFFVTGPNPNGAAYTDKNIALVPGSNTIVSINSINENANPQYYTNNAITNGSNIVFDGYTKGLQASVAVAAGATYNIKLGIVDIGDADYDSGIFIKTALNMCTTLGLGFILFDFDENTNTLFWAFEQSAQVAYFVVEGSLDGHLFQAIDMSVPNHKTSFGIQGQYWHYYRIRAVKHSGEFVISKTIKPLHSAQDFASVWLSNNLIKIKLETTDQNAEIRLFSVSGTLIFTKNLYIENGKEAELTMSEHALVSGLYLLTINTEYGTETKKIFINF